jgi:tetratricopeptide (TPR) repeat protein
VALLLTRPAWGADQKDYSACRESHGESTIAACTRIIDDAATQPRNRAHAFLNRASEWHLLGNLDRAIADYDEVIRLDPKNVDAFHERGLAHSLKGEDARAFADFDAAIGLDPQHLTALVHRGNFRRMQGEFDRAIADYDAAIRINPKEASGYRERGIARFLGRDDAGAVDDLTRAQGLRPDGATILWRFLAQSRLGNSGAAEGAQIAPAPGETGPAATLRALYAGTGTAEAAIATATTPESKCSAAFFTGAWHLRHARKAEAAEEFRRAVDNCPRRLAEHTAATAELGRLKQ